MNDADKLVFRQLTEWAFHLINYTLQAEMAEGALQRGQPVAPRDASKEAEGILRQLSGVLVKIRDAAEQPLPLDLALFAVTFNWSAQRRGFVRGQEPPQKRPALLPASARRQDLGPLVRPAAGKESIAPELVARMQMWSIETIEHCMQAAISESEGMASAISKRGQIRGEATVASRAIWDRVVEVARQAKQAVGIDHYYLTWTLDWCAEHRGYVRA